MSRHLPGAGVAAAVLLLATLVLPGRDVALLAGGAGLGAAAAAWPSLRRALAVPGSTRELRRTARLEGLAAGSLKLAPGLITVAVTTIAADLHAPPAHVQLAQGAFSGVGAVALLVTAWSLRRRAEARAHPRLVLWSFGLMAIGSALVAVAPTVWVLLLAMAVLGLPSAVNARYRYDAMARFPGNPSAFQTISRRWSQAIATLGLVVLGALVASPIGWNGAALATSAWFMVLGCVVHRARARRAAGTAPPPPAGHAALGRLLKLHSVRRFLLVVALATVVGRAGLAHLEPVLAGDLGRSAPVWAAIVLAAAQLATMAPIARINARAERSPRQEARRSTLPMATAAVFAAAAAASSWPWLTLLAAVAWTLLAELATGGTAQSTRLGLQRSGQLATVLGTATGSAGSMLGSLLASAPVLWHPAGLGLALLLGTALCAAAASWRRQRTSRERATTASRAVVITLRPVGEREVTATIRADGRAVTMSLFDGDALGADTPFDERPNCERVRLLRVPVWRGPAWTPHALLARFPHGRPSLRGPWPRNRAAFVGDDLSGVVQWLGAEPLGFRTLPADGGVELRIELPAAERFPVTWYPLRARVLSELPPGSTT